MLMYWANKGTYYHKTWFVQWAALVETERRQNGREKEDFCFKMPTKSMTGLYVIMSEKRTTLSPQSGPCGDCSTTEWLLTALHTSIARNTMLLISCTYFTIVLLIILWKCMYLTFNAPATVIGNHYRVKHNTKQKHLTQLKKPQIKTNTIWTWRKWPSSALKNMITSLPLSQISRHNKINQSQVRIRFTVHIVQTVHMYHFEEDWEKIKLNEPGW